MGDLSGNVRALAMLGEHLYVAGDFSSAGGLDVKYFARVHLDGKVWSAAAPSSSWDINAPVLSLRPVGTVLWAYEQKRPIYLSKRDRSICRYSAVGT